MIPVPNSACWRQLVCGQKEVQTQVLALQMVLKRIRHHLNAASSEASILEAMAQLHAFFVKYQSILTNEIKSL